MTTDELKVNLIALNCMLATHGHFDEPRYKEALDEAIRMLDAEPRARWVLSKENLFERYHCSNCGMVKRIRTKYCGRCGARMDGDEE